MERSAFSPTHQVMTNQGASAPSASMPLTNDTETRLYNAREALIARWEKLVRLERTEANRLDSFTLLSTMPKMIDAVGEALAHKRPGTDVARLVRKLAQEHAFDKLRSASQMPEAGRETARALQDLSRDYGILRKLIFEVLETEQLLSRAERETIIEILSVATEVAQREVITASEAAVERAEQHLKTAFGLAPMALWEIDVATQRILWWQSSSATLIPLAARGGASTESLPFDVIIGRVHPDDRERVQLSLRASVLDGTDLNIEYRLIEGAPPRVHWVRLQGRTILDRETRSARWLGGHFDITDNKLSEQQTRQGDAALRAVVESVSQPLIIHNPDGSIESANRKYLDYFGITFEDLAGSDYSELIHPDDYVSALERWMVALSEGRSTTFEYRLQRSDGRSRWHKAQAVPVRGPSGEIERWMTTNTDIHDSREALEFLKDETELRERVIEIITNDLRSPLHAARTSAQMIAKLPIKSAAEIERLPNLASRAEDQIAKAEKLLRDLGDAVRLHLGEKLELQFEESDLRTLTKDVCTEITSLTGALIEFTAEGEFKGYWSSRELQRALDNYLSERIVKGAANAPVRVILHDDGDQVAIEIQTEGLPLPEQWLDSSFDPLALNAVTGEPGDTALLLSLAVVRGIAEAHGAKISIETNETGLTRLSILLPRDARA